MLELINWVKDGKYRINVLEILNSKPSLPSELATEIGVDRATISRVLQALREKISLILSQAALGQSLM